MTSFISCRYTDSFNQRYRNAVVSAPATPPGASGSATVGRVRGHQRSNGQHRLSSARGSPVPPRRAAPRGARWHNPAPSDAPEPRGEPIWPISPPPPTTPLPPPARRCSICSRRSAAARFSRPTSPSRRRRRGARRTTPPSARSPTATARRCRCRRSPRPCPARRRRRATGRCSTRRWRGSPRCGERGAPGSGATSPTCCPRPCRWWSPASLTGSLSSPTSSAARGARYRSPRRSGATTGRPSRCAPAPGWSSPAYRDGRFAPAAWVEPLAGLATDLLEGPRAR